MLPGLDGTGRLLSEVKEQIASQHSVVALQYPTNLYRYEDLQAWISGILPKDDFIMVAESFSGPLAVMIASEKPAGLRGVVFAATFAKTPHKLPSFLTFSLKITLIKSRMMTWLMQPLLMGKWSRKEFTAKFRAALTLVPTSTIAGRLREILKVDITENLACLDIPIIYLLATNDRLVPPRMSKDFKQTPNAIIAIEGPHFILQANPSASAKYILDFAARFC